MRLLNITVEVKEKKFNHRGHREGKEKLVKRLRVKRPVSWRG